MVPAAGTQGQTLTVNISGQNTSFGQGSSTTYLWFSQGSSTIIYPNSILINNSTNIDAEFTFSYSHPTGYYDVNVYNSLDGDMTLFSGFLLNTGPNPPQIIVVDPNSAYRGQTLLVNISGQNTYFDQGSSTTFVWFNQGSSTIIYADLVNVTTTTELIAGFIIPNDAALGFWDVNIYDQTDGIVTLNNGFRIDSLGTGIEVESIDGKVMFGFYPNPFKDQIEISYNLNESAVVLLEIYDGSGKIVKTIINENQSRGSYLLKEDFKGLGLKPGLYFIRLNAGDNELIMKMMKL